MPTKKNCNAERNAFLKAAQRVSDMEAALYIAQNNLIAALWESAAANIELVQQAVEAVHEGGSKVAVRVTGVLKSIASDKAAEARVKAAKASYDIALANRDKAKQDFDKAQARSSYALPSSSDGGCGAER